MSILIKGMEMPTCCGECPCFHAEHPMHCQLIKPPDKNKRLKAPYGLPRPDWCPLVHVPPHGRLIDADALFKDICDGINAMTAIGLAVDGQWLWGKLNDALENASTIIPAEEGE